MGSKKVENWLIGGQSGPMDPDHDISAVLAGFDGKHVAPLREAAGKGAPEVFLRHLAGPHQVAASWCLKAQAEAGRLRDAHYAEVFAALSTLSSADALLHVLQMVQHAPEAARPYRPEFVRLAGHPRLLVTVWAFDAYIRTTRSGEEADRDARIRQGLRHRSKAMQARARGLAREFGVAV